MAMYKLVFSEPWDWSDHDLRIDVDAAPSTTALPVYGTIVVCSWDSALLGRAAMVGYRHSGDDTRLARSPPVHVAAGAPEPESGGRARGFGPLTFLERPAPPPRPRVWPPINPSPWP